MQMKIQEQQGGAVDEAEPFMGSGRFGTLTTFMSHYSVKMLRDLFPCIDYKCIWLYQLERIYLDIIVTMRKSLKLL